MTDLYDCNDITCVVQELSSDITCVGGARAYTFDRVQIALSCVVPVR